MSRAEQHARYAAYVAARTSADSRGQPMPDAYTVNAAVDAYLQSVRRSDRTEAGGEHRPEPG